MTVLLLLLELHLIGRQGWTGGVAGVCGGVCRLPRAPLLLPPLAGHVGELRLGRRELVLHPHLAMIRVLTKVIRLVTQC